MDFIIMVINHMEDFTRMALVLDTPLIDFLVSMGYTVFEDGSIVSN